MSELRELVAAELLSPVNPRVAKIAAAIAAKHGSASRAVLFYGSCLRQQQLDGLMLDFYLIVSDYPSAYAKRWLAVANRLVPPNVFYFEHDGLVSKYAVLSEGDFARECSVEAGNVSVWARFAQPSRIVWASDDAARDSAVAAIAEAAPTLFALTRPAMRGDDRNDPIAVFKSGFNLTYSAELRAERDARPSSIVDADHPRYEKLGAAVIRERPLHRDHIEAGAVARRRWKRLQRRGKLLSVVRLAKASLTFAGGAEYIAWKINRHAGTAIELKPWQKRHPLLAGITLLPRLLKSGAVR